MCDQTIVSTEYSVSPCLPEPELDPSPAPGEAGTGVCRSLSPAQPLLSVMDSPRWPALASVTPAVTGLRGRGWPCQQCFVSQVSTLFWLGPSRNTVSRRQHHVIIIAGTRGCSVPGSDDLMAVRPVPRARPVLTQHNVM